MLPKYCFKFDLRYRFYILLIISCLFIYNLTKSNYYIKNNSRPLVISSSETSSHNTHKITSFVFPTIKIDTLQTVMPANSIHSILKTTNSSSFLNETFNQNNITNVIQTRICPSIPEGLRGKFKVNLPKLNMSEIEKFLQSQNIEFGGKWKPKHCTPRHHIAILIPFRDRQEHLLQFLVNMHPLFARQEISYGIYLIEPEAKVTFNRGLLFNIGFLEANRDSENLWQCFALHDVDLISEDDRTLYICPDNPTHLSYRISKFGYKPIYHGNFGGVSVLKKEHYEKANGFSNVYFGWGAEDDDFYLRVVNRSLKVDKPPDPFGRYYMHKHKQDKPNPERIKILRNATKRFDKEGLNNVKYRLLEVKKTALYTKFLVTYNQTEIMNFLKLR